MSRLSSFIKSRIKSFSFALEGLQTFFVTQRNAQIHLVATVFVLIAAAYFQVSKTEWLILLSCITLVLAAEAFNTSIEFLTDLVSPDIHPIAKQVKDVAAAAVLICAIGAAIVGSLVFWPYVKTFFAV